MLFGIYVGTTAISLFVTEIFSIIGKKKLQKKGYKIDKKKEKEQSNIGTFLRMVFRSLLPGYNILNAIALLCLHEKAFEYFEEELLKKDIIYKPQDEFLENNLSENEQDDEETQDFSNNESKSFMEKSYEEMTPEEKLVFIELEKEKLTSQRDSLFDEPYTHSRRQ